MAMECKWWAMALLSGLAIAGYLCALSMPAEPVRPAEVTTAAGDAPQAAGDALQAPNFPDAYEVRG